MTYDLFIGDRLFSSWSLRGWLMLEKFGLPYRSHMIGLYSGTMASDMQPLAPARLVPALRLPEGTVVGESLALAETLAERHPEAGLWPQDPAARATARWLCAEMVAGFSALRGQCAMQLLHAWQGFAPSADTLSDIARVESLWAHARRISGATDGPLFGAYSLADVFYTPVAARIISYGLPVSEANYAYCLELLSDTSVRQWRAMGMTVHYDPFPYPQNLTATPWPIGAVSHAEPVEGGPSRNAACPYSGKPVSDYLDLDGQRWGFCNPFCRDKTAADPEAWPKFTAMVSGVNDS
ncbi:glutathione S-transferase N-terminal domain-containing protein [Rhodobacteraceae bacterium B1Z28]|uniref:Glutathione S-transferase N-terminal domain-containing protein n=1 Tax=Ruegeria haliotis TaxID=2747601 RepID=A0ABX2PS77_9RHOB|nr:glutathione S-transferase [Ruegeria haliotis]NVO56506.1 glutathione S-transferase N-terminal domain-containing protein [Ruegeria haliotis]